MLQHQRQEAHGTRPRSQVAHDEVRCSRCVERDDAFQAPKSAGLPALFRSLSQVQRREAQVVESRVVTLCRLKTK